MIEQLARKALTIIKLKFGLPKKGFLTGGSISNIIWELHSGNKAVINDIDIFLYNIPTEEEGNIFKYQKVELNYLDGYKQITSSVFDAYSIKSSTNNGIFNEIFYESVNNSPQLIIDSFDINCVKIGYSIEDDEFYWTDEFEDFIKTGEIKVCNLNTPAHTSIRIVKKKKELNTSLKDFELSMCQHVMIHQNQFLDIYRTRFKQRYADLYADERDYLDNFYKLDRDVDIEKYLDIEKNVDDKIYCLTPKNTHPLFDPNISYGGENIPGFTIPSTSKHFLFYMRNIYKNELLREVWNRFFYFYKSNDYIDIDINSREEDVNMMCELVKSHPLMLPNLDGYKLSEQIFIIKEVQYKIANLYDKETAIAVLENARIKNNHELDEDECLILGLSVRKKVNRPVDIDTLP